MSLDDGISHDIIARNFRLSESTIDTYLKRYFDTGNVYTNYEIQKMSSPKGKVSRVKKLNAANISNYIITKCINDPTTTLDQYATSVMGQFGLWISPTTYHRFFKNMKWKMKKLSTIAREANDLEIALYWRVIRQIVTAAGQMLFIDESHRNDKTPNRLRGRGAPGPVYGVIAFSRGHYKFSFINAVHVTGVKAFHIVFGGVNEEKFVNFFIDKVVDLLQPYPRDFSVVIMDNISFHKSGVIKNIVEDIGCILIFNPRYNPMTNIAEYSFRDSKNIERMKGITGEYASLLSLAETLVSLQNKDYSKEMREQGYI